MLTLAIVASVIAAISAFAAIMAALHAKRSADAAERSAIANEDYAYTAKGMAKADERKHIYKLINDRFDDITTNFSNINIVGNKENIFTGQKALHLLLTSGTLETMRNNLVNDPNLKRLLYIITSLSKLIDDLNKLHEEDRKIVRESIVEFYDCNIQELVNIVLSNRNFLNNYSIGLKELVTVYTEIKDKMTLLRLNQISK